MADKDDKDKNEIASLLHVMHENQLRLTKYIDAAVVKLVGTTEGAKAIAEVIDEHESSRLTKEQREAEIEVFTLAFSKAQNYTKIIVLGFYGTFFGLYSMLTSSLDKISLSVAALYMICSASIFAFHEVMNMVISHLFFIQSSKNAESSKKDVTYLDIRERLREAQKRTSKIMHVMWVFVMILVVALACSAIILLVKELLKQFVT